MQQEQQLRELEKQLQLITEERNSLQRDVEALCLQTQGSSMFSHSHVLAERVAASEKELKETRGKVRALTEARDALSQELSAVRGSKQSAEGALAAEKERVAELESAKEFHQACSTRSMAAKDSMAADLEDMRRKLASTSIALSVAEGRVDSEERGKHAAEATLAKRQQQLAQARHELDAKTAEASSLSRQLHGCMEEVKQLEAANSKLQAKLNLSHEDLDRTKQQLQQLRETEGLLRVQFQETAATNSQLQGTVSGQRDKLVEVETALAELCAKSADRERAAAAVEADLRARLAEAEERVEEQAQELRQQAFELDAQQQLVQRLQQESHHKEVAHAQAAEASRAASSAATAVAGSGGDAETGLSAELGTWTSLSSAPPGAGPRVQDGVGTGLEQGGVTSEGMQGPGHVQPYDEAERSEQLAILNRMVKDMKIKLAQATQEKVDALLLVAQIQNQHHRSSNNGASSPVSTSASTLLDPILSSAAGRGIASYMSSRFVGLMGGATGSWQPLQLPGTSPTSIPSAGQHAALSSKLLRSSMGSYGNAAGVGSPQVSEGEEGISGLLQQQQQQQQQQGAAQGERSLMSEDRQIGQAHLHRQGSTLREGVGVCVHGGMHQETAIGAAAGADGVAAEWQAQQRAVLASIEAARVYEAQLRTAAKALFSQAPEALGQKWAVLTELSKLHEKLHRTRARLGLPAPEPLNLDTCSPTGTTDMPAQKGRAQQKLSLEHEVTAELLGLVDFGLATLEAYNRMEAMSMICPPTTS